MSLTEVDSRWGAANLALHDAQAGNHERSIKRVNHARSMVKVPYQYVWSRHNISPRMLWRSHLMTDESEENQGEVKVDDEDVELDEGGALKELLGAAAESAAPFGGFPNLGSTCYLNATLQCLFHSAPFRRDLLGQAPGASFMGDRLRALLHVVRKERATVAQILAPLADVVQHVLNHTGWAGGKQEDAGGC